MPSLRYRPDIDGMRAVAVVLVLLFHFSLITEITAGFLGVDIFFVISGFLITAIVVGELDEGTFTLRDFYVSRIRRLAPSLFLVLVMTMAAGALWLFPSQLIELSRQVLASQFYFANIYYWQTIGYFGLNAHTVFLLHTWSLAVEEQFYLIYPACLMLLHRYLRRYLLLAILLGLALSFFLNVMLVSHKPEATFYLLPTRAWELLIGALLSVVAGKWAGKRLLNESFGVLGIVLVAVAVTCYRRNVHFPGYYALLPALGAGFLLLAGQNSIVSRGLSSKPLVYVGKISYSLYLVHWPTNVFAGLLIRDYSLPWRLVMFVISFLLAAILFHAIEQPFRRRKVLAGKKRLLLAYGSVLTATLSAFLVVLWTGGLPARFPPEVARLASYADDRSPPLTECEYLGQSLTNPRDFCHIGVTSATPGWLVFGDSHAWAAHAAFDEWLRSDGRSGLFIFLHGCPPLSGIHMVGDKDACFAFNQAIMRFTENNPEVPNIVLVSTWRQAIEGLLSASSQALPTREQSMQLFSDSFSETLQHLNRLGRKVYVWEPVPGAIADVPYALARAKLAHRSADVEFTLADYLSTNKYFFDAVEANRDAIAGSFSPYRALCFTGKCAVTCGNAPLYFDTAHITRSTAAFWVQVLRSGYAASSVAYPSVFQNACSHFANRIQPK
jgi:peptidoglycan/LPS O-acetylase OafA/YrhL